jgi:O-antigen ligase
MPDSSSDPVRRFALGAGSLLLVLGPTALAFFTGGYFEGPRAVAGLGAWLVVVVAALAGARIPRTRWTIVTIAGLVSLAIWTLVSILWAPIASGAYDAGQIALLYVGMLVAASMLLRGRAVGWVEPSLVAGAVVVIGYGLGNRLLPGLLHYSRSVNAEGRLEQPLTYWNAMGELAAIGLVLAIRIAGDASRPRWLRAIAVSMTAPLGLGLYITFSRGALFACLAGVVALIAIAPRREQLWAVLRCVVAGVVAALASLPLQGVTSLSGHLATRETQGLIELIVLVVVAVVTGLAQYRMSGRERQENLKMPRHTPAIATGLVIAGLALAIVVGSHESDGTQALSGGASRLATLQSDRYDYWSVALRAFALQPLHGVGAGGWSVYWLRWRHVSEFAQDAHSLELQTLAELGVVGVAFLATFIVGLLGAARQALRNTPAACGAVAGLVVYLAHSPLDWDWQMPAVTLVALALAGVVLASSVDSAPGQPELESPAARAAETV